MLKISLMSAVLIMFFLCQGCTFHFKSSETELDIERQRIEHNQTYKLEQFGFLDG